MAPPTAAIATPRAPAMTSSQPQPIPPPITTQPQAPAEPNERVGATEDPARALGFSRRGAATPRGQDAIGGTGLYARRFADRSRADSYDSYVRQLFGGAAPA
jgi:hypothetical protein